MASAASNTWVAGCVHYKRFCKLMAPCCGNIYWCRLCHNEKENHTLDRYSVSVLICSKCDAVQPLGLFCQECGIRFGRYTCLRCRMFDNDYKGQFHCEDCGICRLGGEDNFYHCNVCNCCLSLKLCGNHKCVENASRTNCPVCLEDLHTSLITLHVPACGHFLHKKCLEDIKKAGHTVCPICLKNVF